MRRYRKWVLTLGMLAVGPGLAMAAPFPFGQSQDGADSNPAAASKSKNQKVAEDIALALKRSAFHGYEIDIEYREGLATLRGKVSDPRQKTHASQVVSKVAGVRRVENKLVLVTSNRGPIRQVTGVEGEQPAGAGQGRPDALAGNQQKAVEIGRALQAAGLSGYDVEIMFQDGQGVLRGSVGNAEQRAAAGRAASSVPGVQAVHNQLRVEGQGQGGVQQAQGGFQQPQGGYQQGQGGNPRYNMPANYQPVPSMPGPPQGEGPPMAGGSPMGAPMPATGPVGRGPIYDNPNIPDYSWPTYAQYPNYAAVTYPSQYSASAWPYIGPFYPYPQVPLNWRKVTLEWDDGYWDLKFDPRTDRWFWFMNPRNW